MKYCDALNFLRSTHHGLPALIGALPACHVSVVSDIISNSFSINIVGNAPIRMAEFSEFNVGVYLDDSSESASAIHIAIGPRMPRFPRFPEVIYIVGGLLTYSYHIDIHLCKYWRCNGLQLAYSRVCRENEVQSFKGHERILICTDRAIAFSRRYPRMVPKFLFSCRIPL